MSQADTAPSPLQAFSNEAWAALRRSSSRNAVSYSRDNVGVGGELHELSAIHFGWAPKGIKLSRITPNRGSRSMRVQPSIVDAPWRSDNER
jgi:hypothetical protein